MKIYLAAPYGDKPRMEAEASLYEKSGHVVTHKWWVHEETGLDDTGRKACAQADVEGVVAADVVILYNTAKSEGKSFETGVAIALNKPIVAIGKRGEHSSNVFHWLPNFWWVATATQAKAILEVIAWLLGAA